MPSPVNAYALTSATSKLEPLTIKRRDLQAEDVRIDIKWTGICGSDLHVGRNDWGSSSYPFVPGHEIVGIATEVGDKCSKIKKGDYVAIGCLVDSCRNCFQCKNDHEQFCETDRVGTYNSPDKQMPGQNTYGGYSEQILVREHFVVKLPKSLSEDPAKLKAAAPIACAGITTWVPLKRFGCGPGKKVGVVGLGGLGHMAVQLARGLGAEVFLISRTHKKDEAAKKLGAERVYASTNEDEVKELEGSLDIIIDTISVKHDLNQYLKFVKPYGALVLVGYFGPTDEPALNTTNLIRGDRILTGSNIGGLKDTQELFDFCGEKSILPIVEEVRMENINEAWDRMDKSDVEFRFVINIDEFRKNNQS